MEDSETTGWPVWGYILNIAVVALVYLIVEDVYGVSGIVAILGISIVGYLLTNGIVAVLRGVQA